MAKDPKTRKIEFRCTPQQDEQLALMARRMGLRGKSALIRRRFPEVFGEPGTIPHVHAQPVASGHERGLFEPTESE